MVPPRPWDEELGEVEYVDDAVDKARMEWRRLEISAKGMRWAKVEYKESSSGSEPTGRLVVSRSSTREYMPSLDNHGILVG